MRCPINCRISKNGPLVATFGVKLMETLPHWQATICRSLLKLLFICMIIFSLSRFLFPVSCRNTFNQLLIHYRTHHVTQPQRCTRQSPTYQSLEVHFRRWFQRWSLKSSLMCNFEDHFGDDRRIYLRNCTLDDLRSHLWNYLRNHLWNCTSKLSYRLCVTVSSTRLISRLVHDQCNILTQAFSKCGKFSKWKKK